MPESIVFLVRVQCGRKESSRSLSHPWWVSCFTCCTALSNHDTDTGSIRTEFFFLNCPSLAVTCAWLLLKLYMLKLKPWRSPSVTFWFKEIRPLDNCRVGISNVLPLNFFLVILIRHFAHPPVIIIWGEKVRNLTSIFNPVAFSGVTRVGVTRGGNWRCHPYFFLKKTWRPFLSNCHLQSDELF